MVIDGDIDRMRRDGRNVLAVFGVVTAFAFVCSIGEYLIPVDIFLAVQAVAIFVRVLTFNAEIRARQLRDD